MKNKIGYVIAIFVFLVGSWFIFSFLDLFGTGGAEETGIANVMVQEEALPANITNKTIEPPKPQNVCTTVWRNCPSGERVKTVDCTLSGRVVEECPKSKYADKLGELPSTIRYFGLFGCYWEVREKYPYGDMYDPFAVCQQSLAGWKESCECAEEIETFIRNNGKPSLPE